jgi:hypothetical protein
LLKAFTLALGAASAAATFSQVQAMPIQPLDEASPMVLQIADGCGGGRYRGPGGACHWYGRGPYPGGYYGPYRRPYWAYGRPGPGHGCGYGWYRGPGGACHPLGRGPYPGGYYGPYRY